MICYSIIFCSAMFMLLLQVTLTNSSKMKTQYEMIKGTKTFLWFLETRLDKRIKSNFGSLKNADRLLCSMKKNCFYLGKKDQANERQFWSGVQTYFSIYFPENENSLFLQTANDFWDFQNMVEIDSRNNDVPKIKQSKIYSTGFILNPNLIFFKLDIITTPNYHQFIFNPYLNSSKVQLKLFEKLLQGSEKMEDTGKKNVFLRIVTNAEKKELHSNAKKKEEKILSWAMITHPPIFLEQKLKNKL